MINSKGSKAVHFEMKINVNIHNTEPSGGKTNNQISEAAWVSCHGNSALLH